jgi:hypothetical protein
LISLLYEHTPGQNHHAPPYLKKKLAEEIADRLGSSGVHGVFSQELFGFVRCVIDADASVDNLYWSVLLDQDRTAFQWAAYRKDFHLVYLYLQRGADLQQLFDWPLYRLREYLTPPPMLSPRCLEVAEGVNGRWMFEVLIEASTTKAQSHFLLVKKLVVVVRQAVSETM